ncbi:MAG: DUF5320 domain-containing protein [Bacteroidales bacterium]
MPGLNRKGPANEGPMTGRRTGLCNPESPLRNKQGETPEQTDNRPFGVGLGLGRGGRGRGNAREEGLGRGQAAGRGRGRGRRNF